MTKLFLNLSYISNIRYIQLFFSLSGVSYPKLEFPLGDSQLKCSADRKEWKKFIIKHEASFNLVQLHIENLTDRTSLFKLKTSSLVACQEKEIHFLPTNHVIA